MWMMEMDKSARVVKLMISLTFTLYANINYIDGGGTFDGPTESSYVFDWLVAFSKLLCYRLIVTTKLDNFQSSLLIYALSENHSRVSLRFRVCSLEQLLEQRSLRQYLKK